MKSISEAFY